MGGTEEGREERREFLATATKFYRAFTGAPPISRGWQVRNKCAFTGNCSRYPSRYPIGRAQFREIRVTYFSFHGAIRRVTNGGIFMAQPRPFSGAPATPPDPPSYEALAVNLRQPLRRDNIRLPLNFPSPPACLCLAYLTTWRAGEHTFFFPE